MAKTGAVASLQVNMVSLEWTDEGGRAAKPCRGTCGKPTTGRAAVRDLVTGTTRFEAWCMACALGDALRRGLE